jgi:pyruvate-formate lyase
MPRPDSGIYKTISVHKKTHKEIASYGNKDETFDDILKRILKVYKEHKDDPV